MVMSKSRIFGLVAVAWVMFGGPAAAQEHPDGCRYTVTHNGPTWDGNTMVVPYDAIANAWARDGAYGGGGRSIAYGLRSGGGVVAVAAVAYWFRVTHIALPSCRPVEFSSDAELRAEVHTTIHGDADDYALSTGFQTVSGLALSPATLAVAATNAGSPVSSSTLAINFGLVGFTITIPGVSVTNDTSDRDRNTIRTSGTQKTEFEEVLIHCWTKTKVVTNGPFGGYATSTVETTGATASTASKCEIHEVAESFKHDVTEG
jgi:hypothetical protein